MMCERVVAWFRDFPVSEMNQAKNTQGMDRLPQNILFYRDGVSESQFGMVAYEEKKQIREGCQMVL